MRDLTKGSRISCVDLSKMLGVKNPSSNCRCASFAVAHVDELKLVMEAVEFTEDVTEAQFKAWLVEWAMANEKAS